MLLTPILSLLCLLVGLCGTAVTQAETLPPLANGLAPQTHAQLWADFDPRAEPLDVEVLQQWEQDGVVLQVLRFRVGVFKGEKAMIAAVYGYPKGQQQLPGLVQIHGGGQYAHHHACLANAKRGYATLSISWAGRIDAPGYQVTPKEVQLFWDDQTAAPNYKLTTDWGALDGYHAPSRNGQDAFVALPAAAQWTLDAVPSPRNNAWFLNTMAARRALTFLERQPEVDGERLGVYGHSMGGKLTVLTAAADERVRAAAPSCGGISDIRHKNALHHNTVGDLTSLSQIACPILFQSPANDFHGRIDDLPGAVQALRTEDWRITCAPHHNHQDTPEYEVAAQLWFDQHLQGTFRFPQTPQCALQLRSANGVPTASVEVDTSQPVVSVDVYYSQPRPMDAGAKPADDYKHRFWRHAKATRKGDVWQVALPLIADDQPLRVYANVRYALPKPVTSAGYYYAIRSADEFVLSSVLQTVSPAQLQAAEVQATLQPSAMIESFEGDWQQAWFNYGNDWARSTHKVNDAQWAAPSGAKLALQVSCERPNQLAVTIDGHTAAVHLRGGGAWEAIELSPADFNDAAGAALRSFQGIQQLRLQPASSADASAPRWQGAPPVFNDLHWSVPQSAVPQIRSVGKSIPGQPDAMWTYKQVDGKALELSVFLPEGYASSTERFPTFVVFHGGSWAVGEANWHYPDCEYWSRRGMIAVSVDYRLSKRDGVQVPLECVKDAKSAVRFLRKHAAELKVDSDKMVIAGGSAGGQLAAAMATLTAPFTNDACYDLSISCEPNAVILYNPYFRCAPALSPPNFLRPGLPPFITFLGDQDPAISVASLEDFHNQLKAYGGDSEYYVAKGGKHGLCNGRNPRNPFFYWSLELEDQFLVKHGILSGPSLVQHPQGVKVLQPETDYISYR
jgi:acetyl esterase/lipase